MQTQRVVVFKSFNHTTAQSPMWRCTLHHWKLVLLMLSRVKYGGVVVLGEGRGGGDALCSWFKVGWSRNNGHEKNMARSGPLPLLWKARCPKWCMRKWIETFVMILWKLYFYMSTSGLSSRVGFFSQISVVDKDLTLVRESVHHALYVTHTSQSRQSVPSLSEWVKLNLVWVWRLIALISSRRSHQLFCTINRLPPRCYEAEYCVGSKEKKKEKRL